jgi:hypothetical protein
VSGQEAIGRRRRTARWWWGLLPLSLAVLCTGCGTIRVTSDPPGATIQRSSVVFTGLTRRDWQEHPFRTLAASRNRLDASQIDMEYLQYAGQTPTSFSRAYQVEAVRVIWEDDSKSEWQITERDFVGAKGARFHFVKPRP